MIGLTLSEARKRYNVRVVISNGKPCVITLNYMPTRINVETRNGVIIRVDGFY